MSALASAMDWLLCFLLALLRFFAFLSLWRCLRAYIPPSGLVSLAAGLALVGMQVMPGTELLVDRGPWWISLSALREIAIGCLLGLPGAIAFEAVCMCGRACDVLRGSQIGEQLNPGLGSQVSPLENFAVLFALLYFFHAGGYRFLFSNVFQSLAIFPPNMAFCGSLDTVKQFVHFMPLLMLSASAISTAVCAAAPVIILLFLVEVSGALMSRFAGRTNFSFEILPLKLVLGGSVCAVMLLGEDSEQWRSLFEEALVLTRVGH